MLTNVFYDADGVPSGGAASADQSTADNGADTQPAPEETFDTWLEAQPEETKAKVKELYESNISGLKSALKSERDEKKNLSTQLKELLPKAEKGSDLEKQLLEMSSKAEAAERRALFAEEAIKPEIGCRNVKVAFALAVADDLFDKRGNPDWEKIKAAAPELFGSVIANANAGVGTHKVSAAKNDMNSFIRKAAGRE